jgi:hypothetical protein
VAARGEGSASALLTASRQVGSALGVAVVSATLVTIHGNAGHRTAVALLVAAAFAVAGLLTTRLVPSGPAQPLLLRLEHLFPRHAGGLPRRCSRIDPHLLCRLPPGSPVSRHFLVD